MAKFPLAARVGGLYGINIQTLAGNKTLTPGPDKIYQYLDEGDANRIITLATAGTTAGDRFVIRHNGVYTDTHYLEVRQAATMLDMIYAGAIKEFIFDGTNWISRGIGTGENDSKKENVAIGCAAWGYSSGTAVGKGAMGYDNGAAVGSCSRGYTCGAAVGYNAFGYNNGVAVGYSAYGYDYGVAVGRSSGGNNYGVAVGYGAQTGAKEYSIALGYQSACVRVGETSININGSDADQENNAVQGRWSGDTATAAPVEIFCGGKPNARFTIRPSSVLAFDMIIVARDNVANEVARYSVHDGLIKRDGANNTVMVLCTIVVDHEDDATWGVAVTADDANEALIITVTGDATNPVQWAAVMNGVETHF